MRRVLCNDSHGPGCDPWLMVRRSLALARLPLRRPTAILHGLLAARIAPLGLGLVVELALGSVVDASLTRVRREVALDRVIGGARPGVLRRNASAERRRRILPVRGGLIHR